MVEIFIQTKTITKKIKFLKDIFKCWPLFVNLSAMSHIFYRPTLILFRTVLFLLDTGYYLYSTTSDNFSITNYNILKIPP